MNQHKEISKAYSACMEIQKEGVLLIYVNLVNNTEVPP